MFRSPKLSGHEADEQQPAALDTITPVASRSTSSKDRSASAASIGSSTPHRRQHEASGEAAPSQRSSARTNGSSSNGNGHGPSGSARPPQSKRRRLDADLGFSSPGPAFMIAIEDDAASSSGAEGSGVGVGRPRRARRGVVVADQAASSLSPLSTKASKLPRSTSASVPLASHPTIEPLASEAEVDAEAGGRSGSSSRSAEPPDRPKSRSRRLSPPQQRKGVADAVSVSHPRVSSPPRSSPKRARTAAVAPITALTAQRPFDEILALRRQERLQASQEELEEVHDSHDTLVRELFHLVKFFTLVGYDPEVAEDRSDVFSQFQQEHDLRFALEASSEAGPSAPKGRITRRGVNARLEELSLRRSQPSTPAAPLSTAAAAAAAEQPTPSNKRRESSQRLRRSTSLAVGTGAEAEDGAGDDNDDGADDIEPTPTQKGKRRASSRELEATRGARARSSVNDRIVEIVEIVDSPSSSARDRRSAGVSAANGKVKVKGRSSGINVPASQRGGDTEDGRLPRVESRALPEVPPPIRALGPHHVPQPPKFNGSVGDFWSSFRLVEEEDLEPAKADEAERQLLETHLRIDLARRSGLMALGESIDRVAKLPPHAGARKRDHYDHLLEAVASASHQMRQNHKQRLNLARKVSRMVAVYWDRRFGSSERERRAEQRRIRALAKWTVREVAKQWRLAVNVVRARKAAFEKAEKEKLDKEQLNAILEKSTQMLQKQHEEMARMEEIDDDDSDIDSDSEQSHYSDDDENEQDAAEDDGDRSADDESIAASDSELRCRDITGSISEDGGDDLTALLDDAEASPVGGPSSSVEKRSHGLASPFNAASRGRGAPPSRTGAVNSEPLADDDVSGPPAPTCPNGDGEMSEQQIKEATPSPRLVRSSRRTRKSVLLAPPSAGSDSDAPDPDADDIDFSAANAETAAEDDELERQMWEEAEDDDSDSEDAGLAADADVPIEELLKRYGYGDSGGDGDAAGTGDEDDHDAVPSDQPEAREGADADDTADAIPGSRDDLRGVETPPSVNTVGTPQAKANLPTSEHEHEHKGTEAEEASHRRKGGDADDEEDAAASNDVDASSDEGDVEVDTPRSRSRSLTARLSSAHTPERAAGGRARQPFLLRGQLRPYQRIGFEWLAGLYANGVNGILADEMGLGKTIQTISLLAHLACDKGVWGPHLVVAPTSVMLNWEVEFKKFLPGFKILSYFGSQKERKEKRIGWNTDNSFNVCITSYQLVLADQHIFRRKPWVYLVLDEAHHIKNFRSQRWQTLLGFNSQRRLLLTGTPLQNNLMDLWSLMYFLMPHGVADLPGGGAFASMKDFQDWFSRPLDKAIEGGLNMDDEMRAMIHKLHTVLRPYLLRRLKSEVEKELPRKYEHVIPCRLSKRQRFLYNDFMSRAKTRESLASGNYLSIINCLMQLRKVCNHPDLFEVRPIVTSFAMSRSVVADYEVKDLLVRRRLLSEDALAKVDLDATNLRITAHEEHLTPILTRDLRRLNASKKLPFFREPAIPPPPPALNTWSLDGFRTTLAERRRRDDVEHWKHIAYVNQYRCTRRPVYGRGLISLVRQLGAPSRLLPLDDELVEADRRGFLDRCDRVGRLVKSHAARVEALRGTIDRFAFVTPRAVAVDMPQWALPGLSPATAPAQLLAPSFDTLHPVAVKLHIAFPDASLLQYDCGKLQQLDVLMRRLKQGGHRILIFTQMTKVLDILESFLNYHGYRYLRLDGATKVEQRQALTEKFNRDLRISAFILSTRSGGLGINLTGADTVLFYDLDWNAAIEAQCMDRAHRIGQTRDVHIYRFVSEHTIEENMLRKASQKRRLDSVVIREGDFTTEKLGALGGGGMAGGAAAAVEKVGWRDMLDDEGAIEGVKVQLEGEAVGGAGEAERALAEAEDEEDRMAARHAREEMGLDELDFDEAKKAGQDEEPTTTTTAARREREQRQSSVQQQQIGGQGEGAAQEVEQEDEEGETIDDYMLRFVEADWEHFA